MSEVKTFITKAMFLEAIPFGNEVGHLYDQLEMEHPELYLLCNAIAEKEFVGKEIDWKEMEVMLNDFIKSLVHKSYT